MKVVSTILPGVMILDPAVHGDGRGYFFESFNQATYAAHGIDASFVQTNVSRSSRGVLRGLHYQWPAPQGKLVSVMDGEIYDVAVDIRVGSPTLGQHVAVVLSAANKRHLWIPPGFAHGFCVLSEAATLSYQCTTLYDRAADMSIRWNDAQFAIDWPVSEPDLSAKDRNAVTFDLIPNDRRPTYTP